jgi:glycosyltransferase involved in cell wall biosynthesis
MMGGLVRELGFVQNSELRTLYENAACFVFPSIYEGFGLPALEALSLGCPIVAARSASLPEILGEAVVYCNPQSVDDIAAQISRVLQGQHPNRHTAIRHAAKFTWERCARETWKILLNALRGEEQSDR